MNNPILMLQGNQALRQWLIAKNRTSILQQASNMLECKEYAEWDLMDCVDYIDSVLYLEWCESDE